MKRLIGSIHVSLPGFSREQSAKQASRELNYGECCQLVDRQLEVAERQGFEPWRRFPAYTRSRRAPSTARPPLRDRPYGLLELEFNALTYIRRI